MAAREAALAASLAALFLDALPMLVDHSRASQLFPFFPSRLG